MGRRAQHTSSYCKTDNKHNNERHSYVEDRISQFPDEILVHILSHVTIKEAARTSVLSRRWENLWTYFIGRLNFDGSKMRWEILKKPRLLKVERSKFIKLVNQVCKSHKGPTINNFRVCFQLDKSSGCHVDKWIEFAIAKRVQGLELDFRPFIGGFPDHCERYIFPHECFVHMKSRLGLSCIMHLKVLCFRYVKVTGELLEYFLSNCPALEQLCVEASEHLIDLKVSGPSLRLKHLEISHCVFINYVEIAAPNLASLKFFNQNIELRIKYAPRLVHVLVGGGYDSPSGPTFSAVSSYLLQLETLKLYLPLCRHVLEVPQFPMLCNLRHMTWTVLAFYDTSILELTSLIEASPFLQTFTLELISFGPRNRREIQRVAHRPHRSLKVVELIGFVGRTIDVELAIYLLEHAVILEKIIINPLSPLILDIPLERRNESEKKAAARKTASELQSKLRPGAKMVIL